MGQEGLVKVQGIWRDRAEAGRELAQRLRRTRELADGMRRGTTVVGLAEAGLPVAAAVATELELPLARWTVRRLTVPEQTGRGCGALAPGGVEVWNEAMARRLGLAVGSLGREELVARHHLALRAAMAADSPAAALRGRRLLLVDDAIVGGATMVAALASLRRVHAKEVCVAVPLATRAGMARLALAPERFTVLRSLEPRQRPGNCYGCGPWYGADSASSSR
jgi:putative phosphoribosyl transferase